jgi:prepilin-type N-terminal cleavage/methylation domain-containing protein/prepilin-type processing-associated H-X9-DG protein
MFFNNQDKIRGVQKSGFTLVELLVVIAIIALLLSILMPSLQRAKELAKQIVCSSREKQLALALMTYTQDYRGYIMPYAALYVEGATSQSQVIHKEGPEDEYWYAMLYAAKGIDNRDVFFCPSILPSSNKQYKAINKDASHPQGSNVEEVGMGWTIGMRDWAIQDAQLSQWINDRAPKKLTSIPKPSDFFLLADSVTPNIGNSYFYGGAKFRQTFGIVGMARQYSWKPGLHLRHNDKAGAVFADGHTEYKPKEYWCELQNPKNWQKSYFVDSLPGFLVYDASVQTEWRWVDGQYIARPTGLRP